MAPANDHSFELVNVGAHRKPPPLVGAPALTLHYGLWRPKESSPSVPPDGTRGESDLAPDAWQHAIDLFLCRLYLRLRPEDPEAPFISPNYDGDGTLYLLRYGVSLPAKATDPIALQPLPPDFRSLHYDVFTVLTRYEGWMITVRAELFSEFWTLTILCDLDQLKPVPHPLGERTANEPVNLHYERVLSEVHDYVRRIYAENGKPDCAVAAEPAGKEQEMLEAINQRLYGRFKIFVDGLVNGCLDPNGAAADGLCKIDQLGIVFAEFHGTIFGFGQGKGEEPFDFFGVGRNHRASGTRRPIHRQVGTGKFSGDVPLRILDAMWPVIKHLQLRDAAELRKVEKHGKSEFTASLFQNGRAIYVSSLGWLDPTKPEGAESPRRPVSYTLIVCYESRWSLGRLVERIHNMGTARLAAIWEIDEIERTGDELRRIEDTLTEEERRNNGNVADPDRFAAAVVQAGSSIRFGLMHRVDRSSYYVWVFEQNLANLRGRRIEGFQPYDQFVRRRMASTFDYIARVGRRYAELRREIDLLLRKSSSKNIVLLTGKISATLETSEHMQATMAGVLRKMEDQERKTTRLLHCAEVIILIPLVYYVGHIFQAVLEWPGVPMLHAVGALLAGLCSGLAGPGRMLQRVEPEPEGVVGPGTIAGYLLAALFVIRLIRELKRWRQEQEIADARRPTEREGGAAAPAGDG